MSETEAKNARSKAKFNRAKAKAKAKMKSKAKAKAKSVRRRLSFGAKCLPQTQFESTEAHGVPQAENAPEQLQPVELERHGPCKFQAGNDAEAVQPPSGLPQDKTDLLKHQCGLGNMNFQMNHVRLLLLQPLQVIENQ